MFKEFGHEDALNSICRLVKLILNTLRCSAGRYGRARSFPMKWYTPPFSVYAGASPRRLTFRYTRWDQWKRHPFTMVLGNTSRTACHAAKNIKQIHFFLGGCKNYINTSPKLFSSLVLYIYSHSTVMIVN